MFVENKKVRQLFGFHGMDTKSNEPYHWFFANSNGFERKKVKIPNTLIDINQQIMCKNYVYTVKKIIKKQCDSTQKNVHDGNTQILVQNQKFVYLYTNFNRIENAFLFAKLRQLNY
jgi:hypothetical protein